MISILRSTAILGSSAIIAILAGLASSKVCALLLGPGGFGLMGLLQSLLAFSVMIAGMGVGVGLVRSGAESLAREDLARLAAARRAAGLLVMGLGAAALLLLVALRVPVSRLVLGGPDYRWPVILIGVAVLFSLASGIQTSTINAYHRVGTLARIGILNSILVASVSILFVWLWREQGIAPAILFGAIIGFIVSRVFLVRTVGNVSLRASGPDVMVAARSLLRFGVPYTASMIVGAGVQLLMPVLVLRGLGLESVGFYQAATLVSVGYLAFLTTAMAQDYYPRLSASGDDPAILTDLVNQQHRLVMLVAVPIILAVLGLAPYLTILIYSSKFSPASEVLEWQLIGDLFKFSSFTMSFLVLARSSSMIFFFLELIGGLTAATTSWFGMQRFGLAGLGISFLVTNIVYYLVVWIIVRRQIRLVWTRENKMMMLAAISAALVIRLLPFAGFESLRLPMALSFAFLAGSGSLWIIWRERNKTAPASIASLRKDE
jgi:PST family polysaccharide transporter